eukprot:448710-Karenia_brevis.AAC.1
MECSPRFPGVCCPPPQILHTNRPGPSSWRVLMINRSKDRREHSRLGGHGHAKHHNYDTTQCLTHMAEQSLVRNDAHGVQQPSGTNKADLRPSGL